MNNIYTQGIILSLLPLSPLELVNCSGVNRAWRKHTHKPEIVQNVIFCFERALGTECPVRYEPERLWEELLKRCWIQAWMEKPVFSEESPLHPSGYIGEDALPKCIKRRMMVITNPNHPELLGIYSKNSFSLFDRETQKIAKILKKPYKGGIETNIPSIYEHLYLFTNQMLVRRCLNDEILCTSLDSTWEPIKLKQPEYDCIACEDRVTVIDEVRRLHHYTIGEQIDHSVIDLDQALLEFSEFREYEIMYAYFVRAKLEKKSCIVAMNLYRRDEGLLIFLNISCGETISVNLLGYHSIVDRAFNYIMKHKKAFWGTWRNIFLIDSEKNKYLFCLESLPQAHLDCFSYYNGCLAMLIDEVTVQIWTFIKEEDRIVVPRHIRTIEVANHSGELNGCDFNFSKNGFTLVEPDYQKNVTEVVHTYRLLLSRQPKAEKQDNISLINSRTIRQLLFSHLTPLDLLNVNLVCKDWYQDAHVSTVVQNVIYCFERALGAESPVKCEPERLREELLRRCWMQAWMENPVVSKTSSRHPSGHIEEAILPKINKGEYWVLRNPNHPDLLGIFTSEVAFSLFNRKTKRITHSFERPRDHEFNFGNENYLREFQLPISNRDLHTDRMLVVRTNVYRDLCCTLFDSKVQHCIEGLRIEDFTAHEDCVIAVDREHVLHDFTISEEGRIDHGNIDLKEVVLQYSKFNAFAISTVRLLNTKQKKGSCIAVIHLKKDEEQILLYLNIHCRSNFHVRLGHHPIDVRSPSCHLDLAVNRIMVHETEDSRRIKRIHIIDFVKRKQSCVLLQGSYPSYHNSCLAILANFKTVQLWTIVEDEDGFKPCLLRTVEVEPQWSRPGIDPRSNLKLTRTHFAITQPHVSNELYTYRFSSSKPKKKRRPPKLPSEKRRCTIQ